MAAAAQKVLDKAPAPVGEPKKLSGIALYSRFVCIITSIFASYH
jgi:hypothetical protein